jgi:hypothetical protein
LISQGIDDDYALHIANILLDQLFDENKIIRQASISSDGLEGLTSKLVEMGLDKNKVNEALNALRRASMRDLRDASGQQGRG